MGKICTSLEQSKKLIELGIDVNTADMYYYTVNGKSDWYKTPNVLESKDDLDMDGNSIPCWSLAALLCLIPDKISINNESYYLSFTKKSVDFKGPITWDGQKAESFEMDNILDSAFEMVCWLKEIGKL